MDNIVKMVHETIGHPLDIKVLNTARTAADIKLHHLIDKFGDAEGKRREPWYLTYLIVEQLCSDSISKISWQFNQEDRGKK